MALSILSKKLALPKFIIKSRFVDKHLNYVYTLIKLAIISD